MSNLYDSNYRVIFISVVILICQYKCAILVTQPALPSLCNSLLGLFSNFDINPFMKHFMNFRLLKAALYIVERRKKSKRELFFCDEK